MTTIEIEPARAALRRRSGRGGRRLIPIDPPGQAPTRIDQESGVTRLETWQARSRDGLWLFERIDDVGTPWRVTYLPTGQTRDWLTSLNDARHLAATVLGDELRAEALRAALDPEAADGDRAAAHGWLGWYLRVAANDGADVEPTARCRCGGLLIDIEYRGADHRVHIAGCDECWTPGVPGFGPLDPEVCNHRVCGTPAPVACAHAAGTGCTGSGVAYPDGGDGCVLDGGRGECCRCCRPH